MEMQSSGGLWVIWLERNNQILRSIIVGIFFIGHLSGLLLQQPLAVLLCIPFCGIGWAATVFS